MKLDTLIIHSTLCRFISDANCLLPSLFIELRETERGEQGFVRIKRAEVKEEKVGDPQPSSSSLQPCYKYSS